MYAIKDHIIVVRTDTEDEAFDHLNRYLTGRYPGAEIIDLDSGEVVAKATIKIEVTRLRKEVKKDVTTEDSPQPTAEELGVRS